MQNSSTNAAFTNGATNSQQNVGKSGNTATTQDFPPPKTDKPRPHVCGTCSRSFARLEHLKRHERSHTKEKPFECPECTRCFARRDLLLRHQQKLHMSSTPSSRPRAGRRESMSSITGSGPGRVRKSSVANSTGSGSGGPGAPTVRPRANTISHVDGATLGMFANSQNGILGLSHLPSLAALHGPGGYEFRSMSTALGHHGNFHALPKIDTHGLDIGIGGGLRTAPPYLPVDADYGHYFYPPGPTVNPAQLHFSDSPHTHSMMTHSPPFQHAFPGMPAGQVLMEDDDRYDWMQGFDNRIAFSAQNENAVEGSSPSAMSSASQSGISEVMLDGSNGPAQASGPLWPEPPMMPPATMASNQFSMELAGTTFGEINPGTISPSGHQGRNGSPDGLFSTSKGVSRT
ncbi:MAG: hypothetical protein M1839_004077 [Geoglossum umbratile]|nr:MAG: hypothetical protein M1839_004077 [Geoglossum umbratile]